MPGTNLLWPISTHTNACLTDGNGLALLVTCDTTPETQANTYSAGCLLVRTDNSTFYQNTGTAASPVWTINGVGAAGPTGPTGYTGASVTGATGYTGFTGYTGYTGPGA